MQKNPNINGDLNLDEGIVKYEKLLEKNLKVYAYSMKHLFKSFIFDVYSILIEMQSETGKYL